MNALYVTIVEIDYENLSADVFTEECDPWECMIDNGEEEIVRWKTPWSESLEIYRR